MHLSLINLSDALSLLEFERQNKDWFDQFIPPREAEFYSLNGVKQHIRELLLDYHSHEMLPMLIKDGKQIVGRINVSEIEHGKRSALLGYRVGQEHINQGVAKWAVSKMIEQLSDMGINQVVAHASPDNPASCRVLEKNGFVSTELIENFACVSGEAIHCYKYVLDIPEK